jgi:hypothetical protein
MITIKFKDTFIKGFMLLASCLLLLASCDKVTDFEESYVSQHDQPNSGAPVIKAVYAVADADQLQPLHEVTPLQRVVITGENLNNLRSLKFNGVEADLSQTYTKLTEAVVQVPGGYVRASSDVVTYTTDMGTGTYTFIPAEVVYSFNLLQATQQQTDKNVSIEVTEQNTVCLHFSGMITEWSWVELSFAQPFSQISDAATVAQYNFAFEVQNTTGKALLGSGYEFAFNWDWNNSYRWNPGNGDGLDTNGQWQTVRCALDKMAPDGLSASGSDLVLNIGFQPDRDYEADFRLANFRIEKK